VTCWWWKTLYPAHPNQHVANICTILLLLLLLLLALPG
jgi:hypothetical protein